MNNIVADGRERLLEDPGTQEQIAHAIRQVFEKHRQEWEQAGFWKKLRLRWKIESEINAAIEKIAPSRGLYFSASKVMSQNNRVETDSG